MVTNISEKIGILYSIVTTVSKHIERIFFFYVLFIYPEELFQRVVVFSLISTLLSTMFSHFVNIHGPIRPYVRVISISLLNPSFIFGKNGNEPVFYYYLSGTCWVFILASGHSPGNIGPVHKRDDLWNPLSGS